jgi:hypothetical protein
MKVGPLPNYYLDQINSLDNRLGYRTEMFIGHPNYYLDQINSLDNRLGYRTLLYAELL